MKKGTKIEMRRIRFGSKEMNSKMLIMVP